MNAPEQIGTPIANLPALLSPLDGGYYIGLSRSNGQLYAIISAPKTAGQIVGRWGEYGQDILSATSLNDGRANTAAMAAAGCEIAVKTLALYINGKNDWYIPALDELEVMYRNAKPTAVKNDCWLRSGINLNSYTPAHPYTPEDPAQTPCELFVMGGQEAFDDEWHWTSTQYSANNAWTQYFSGGYQGITIKDCEGLVRPVRRLLVIE